MKKDQFLTSMASPDEINIILKGGTKIFCSTPFISQMVEPQAGFRGSHRQKAVSYAPYSGGSPESPELQAKTQACGPILVNFY